MKNFIKSLIFPQAPDDVGEVLLEWQIPEFFKHDRQKSWYIGAVILSSFFLIYSIVTVNFLFAVIVLLLAFILVLQHYQKPRNFKVKLTDLGILVNQRFYPYKEFQAFWFIYNPPKVKNLYLDFKLRRKRELTVPLMQTNPLMVRDLLEQFLAEDLEKDTEPFEETFSRLVKF